MIYLWVMSSMLYYFMSYYLIYLPGNTYTNTYSAGGAEVVAVFFGGVLAQNMSARWSFFISNSISLTGGLLILFLGEKFSHLMPFFVITAKFGISSAYMLCYAVTFPLFPTLFAAQAYGFCNFSANIISIFSPYMA